MHWESVLIRISYVDLLIRFKQNWFLLNRITVAVSYFFLPLEVN